MTPENENLWRRLLSALGERGMLPQSNLTPAEIARHIYEAWDDDRVYRFVWDYYYPNSYGQMDSALSESEAAQLVAFFENPSPSPPLTDTREQSVASVETPAETAPFPANPVLGQNCSICGRPDKP